jgi:hypothetical protein
MYINGSSYGTVTSGQTIIPGFNGPWQVNVYAYNSTNNLLANIISTPIYFISGNFAYYSFNSGSYSTSTNDVYNMANGTPVLDAVVISSSTAISPYTTYINTTKDSWGTGGSYLSGNYSLCSYKSPTYNSITIPVASGNGWTLSFWFNAPSGGYMAIGGLNTGTNWYALNSGTALQFITPYGNVDLNIPTYCDAKWHYLTAMISFTSTTAGNSYLYVDNVLKGTTAFTSSTSFVSNGFATGNTGGYTPLSTTNNITSAVLFDNIRLFNIPLSAAQRTNLYNLRI